MKISKGKLEILFLTLRETQGILSLKEARVRDAFMKPLGEAVDRFYKERTAIYEKFCKKNEEGNPDIQDDKYTFPTEVQDELTKELTTLLEEEVEVKYDWGVTSITLKEILEKSDYKPKYGEVEVIDSIINTL